MHFISKANPVAPYRRPPYSNRLRLYSRRRR